MRISDWSSDVCSSDLRTRVQELSSRFQEDEAKTARVRLWDACGAHTQTAILRAFQCVTREHGPLARSRILAMRAWLNYKTGRFLRPHQSPCSRSEELTSELQSLIRITSAVF